MHYYVQANPGYSFPLTFSPTADVADQGQITPGGGSTSVSVSASILNGNWDGPYYFHNGQYTTLGVAPDGVDFASISTPWANNTHNSTPTIEDQSDDTSLFSYPVTNSPQSETEGNITPVWYWNGPNLGVLPPSFEIDVEAEAEAVDYTNTYDSGVAQDGLGDPDISIPGGAKCSGSESVAVTVQSDEYAPGQGNGYWAIGPTVHLKSLMKPPSNEYLPYNLFTEVLLSASIESGLNN